MDNEDKINGTVHEGVQLFLKDVHPEAQETSSSYDLSKEYAKTRRNKTPGLWVPLAVCVAVVLVTSFAISFFVNRTNERITVSVDAFEDLSLTSLLDTVSETRASRDTALKEAQSLASELEAELSRAARNRDADLFTISSLGLSSAEDAARRREVQASYDDAVALAHAQYDPRIAEQEAEAERYQRQLDEYDSARLELAREKENAINSQKQLFEMEKSQLVASYEDTISQLKEQLSSVQEDDLDRQLKAVNDITQKYLAEIDSLDPVITDATGNAIVLRTDRTEISERFAPFLFTAGLSAEASEEFREALSRAESLFSDFDYSQSVVAAIPQKNSIPLYVRTSSRLSHTAGNEIVRASAREVNRLAAITQEQRGQIALLSSQNTAYRAAMLSCASAAGADGVVVLAEGPVLTVLLSSEAEEMLSSLLAEAGQSPDDAEPDDAASEEESVTETPAPSITVFSADRSSSVSRTVIDMREADGLLRVTLSDGMGTGTAQGLFVAVQ